MDVKKTLSGFANVFKQKVGTKATGKSRFVEADKSSHLDFSHIAGNKEAVAAVSDIVEFLKKPDKFTAYGARMPKGVLLFGPPGTGKTMLARAVAGESGAAFFAVNGSDFVQMYVGVGASRVRELFKEAKQKKPAVIFIDEIDALAKRRTGGSGGSDERDQTLNALLTEMSGFEQNSGIVVMGATNRLDVLDEAVLRPGRFDRHVEMCLPDRIGRERILRHHAKNKPLADDVDLSNLAAMTVYFSGAQLESLLNEAAISAARDDLGQITLSHIDLAYTTILAGACKLDQMNKPEKEREITAYHEAGHGLMTKLALPGHRVMKLSILPSIKAEGYCLSIPPDQRFLTRSELHGHLLVALAGRAAEQVVFGYDNITTGSANDLEKAGNIAIDLVLRYGMGPSGLCPKLSQDAAGEQANRLVESTYQEAVSILHEHRSELDDLAKRLLEKEVLDEI